MHLLSKVKCLIFDCDGTLVDSEPLCNLGLELALKQYGITVSTQDLMSRFRGAKLQLITEHLQAEYKIIFGADFVPTYRNIVDDLFTTRLEPNAGVARLLESLQIPICVASSAPLKKIHHALSTTGLLDYFDGNIFSCYELGKWKPEPDIFIHAAQNMGVAIGHCAVVEDSEVGLMAAERAGALTIHYDQVSQQVGKLGHSRHAQYRITHMAQLAMMLAE